LQFDALDYQWTRWVLGYSNEQQYNLLKKLFGDGIKWKATAIIFSVIVGVMLFLILIKRFNFKAFKKEKTTVELRLYKKILSKLAKKGLIKPIDMTPNEFALSLGSSQPELSKELLEFNTLFQLLSYQKQNMKLYKKQVYDLEKKYISINKIISKIQFFT
jgi:uncharacterized membrane protein YuzA (DUF378 family)